MKKNSLFSINKSIIFKVIILHFIIILFLNLSFKHKKPTKKENLIVKNIIIKTKEKNIRPIKKNIIKNNIQKKPVVTNNPTIKNHDNLIKKLESQIKNLDSLNLEQKKITTKLSIPENIKKIEKPISSEDDLFNLKEILIKELQNNLKLPEYGEVKISFIIQPSGEITDINILDYKSFNNQNYLKNKLSELSFKDMNKFFDQPQRFTVIFKNE